MRLIKPYHILFLATSLCLAVFLLSLALPRIDNNLIGSDGIGYYSNLPSILLDRDFDFTDEYARFYPADSRHRTTLTANGIPGNRWPIGTAIFWSPFFLIAHIAAVLGGSDSVDGTSQFYQAIVLSGSIIYGGIGLWLCYRCALIFFRPFISLIATLSFLFAGNLIYYMTAEPYMSHTVSLCLSGLFTYIYLTRRNEPISHKTALLYGIIAGFMALVRPQDGLFLIIPFVMQLISRQPFFQTAWRALESGIVALGIYAIQLLFWYLVYGDAFAAPYTSESTQSFFWLSPRIGAVLFSSYRGLIIWHPIYSLALVGIFFLYRSSRHVAIATVLAFVIQLYIVSAWREWWQGDAFGGRMFIVCLPFLTIALAAIIRWWLAHKHRLTLALGIGTLIGLNFFLFVVYRFDLVLANHPPTWYEITLYRFVFFLDKLGF